jgi:DNA-binding transcriptional ArsR family regulator
MGEGQIVLDREAFKALASETRVALLKKLDERRHTQSELSKETGLSVQAVSEHLEKMEQAELVKRIEREGRKWVYFDLTQKGYALLHPERKNFFVLLGVSVLLIAAASYNFVSKKFFATQVFAQAPYAPVMRAAGDKLGATVSAGKEAAAAPLMTNASATPSVAPNMQPIQQHLIQLSSVEALALILGVLLFVASAYFAFRKRDRKIGFALAFLLLAFLVAGFVL